jgi:hypothetical protein
MYIGGIFYLSTLLPFRIPKTPKMWYTTLNENIYLVHTI